MELRLIGALLALALVAGCSRTTCRCGISPPVSADSMAVRPVSGSQTLEGYMRPEEMQWLLQPDSTGSYSGY